jgi:hypothetical protein
MLIGNGVGIGIEDFVCFLFFSTQATSELRILDSVLQNYFTDLRVSMFHFDILKSLQAIRNIPTVF